MSRNRYDSQMHTVSEPFRHGMLARPHGAQVYWETSGNPSGIPALYLHGGPGSGLGNGGYRRRFDPDRYLVVGLDQRGCGRSTPWAIDDLDNLDENNTGAVIADIEALREHLGISAWLVHGVSWGSTLALAYALEHPTRVTALVLMAVTTGSREEVDWLTSGVGVIFPEAWERFAAAVPDGQRPVEYYAQVLRSPDARARGEAAMAWDEWESAHVSLDPAWLPGHRHEDPRTRENFATLVTHYWAQDCFLTGDNRILERASRLAGTPGDLIHGRRDVSSPSVTPWRLHKACSESRLQIVEAEGHGGKIAKQLATEAIDTVLAR